MVVVVVVVVGRAARTAPTPAAPHYARNNADHVSATSTEVRQRYRGLPMNNGCSHIDQIDLTVQPSSTEGCSECLRIRASWVHLRMCMSCGEVACCDSAQPSCH